MSREGGWRKEANIPEQLSSGLLCFPLVDEFHQDALVLEPISLALEVELMVPVAQSPELIAPVALSHHHSNWEFSPWGKGIHAARAIYPFLNDQDAPSFLHGQAIHG